MPSLMYSRDEVLAILERTAIIEDTYNQGLATITQLIGYVDGRKVGASFAMTHQELAHAKFTGYETTARKERAARKAIAVKVLEHIEAEVPS